MIRKRKLNSMIFTGIIFSYILISIAMAVPQYDPEILDAFDNASEINIIVKLYNGNATKVDEVLSSLPQQEFKLQRVSPTASSFNGNITKKGFDILINNSDIKSVYLVEILQVAEKEIQKEVDKSNEEVIEDGLVQNAEEVIKEEYPEQLVEESEDIYVKLNIVEHLPPVRDWMACGAQ